MQGLSEEMRPSVVVEDGEIIEIFNRSPLKISRMASIQKATLRFNYPDLITPISLVQQQSQSSEFLPIFTEQDSLACKAKTSKSKMWLALKQRLRQLFND
ncbi:MAG: hypothetical protein O2952_05540 [Bacteroidetes bacterium]|jgi:hypothetical protein|nr:hypothetical protein [Bacteroidota bacterium]MDA1115170.1 hypothetical protein [Bacteroidota bacterium]